MDAMAEDSVLKVKRRKFFVQNLDVVVLQITVDNGESLALQPGISKIDTIHSRGYHGPVVRTDLRNDVVINQQIVFTSTKECFKREVAEVIRRTSGIGVIV